ncbi:hypothetical protein F2Q68_00010683 [Brassica cretica]|uniref:Uncharacterized protein n=1 Tax=Brassica cretica TaxID=69181 RepID=A0A8S9KZG9_BRACR|nr:hypothetical protein F2Q68_00010683 [Brassica cretica]
MRQETSPRPTSLRTLCIHLLNLRFTKSRNGISRSINQMMYSMLHFGYSKWSMIPSDERELWFRQFTDLVIKGVVDLVEAEIASQSQPLSDDGDSTGASTNLPLLQINEMVEKPVPKRKEGRLVGLARRASSYPAPSSQAPYADPMILEELHDKDERIGALEEQNTTILSENATIRSENATILAELASQKKFNAEIMQKLWKSIVVRIRTRVPWESTERLDHPTIYTNYLSKHRLWSSLIASNASLGYNLC